MSELCVAAMAGRADVAWAIQKRLLPVHKNLFTEANPIPVKWALEQMGRIESGIRLPLVPFSTAGQGALRAALQSSGLL
jgi:4-hydroxy-tetrahydrodipicolinate synthase